MNRFTSIAPRRGRCQGQYAADVASRPGRRTTIRELAEYTGLSPAAVSYALRGMQVSAETERRVREAAEELGYEADPIARALAGGSTGVVGLLVGSLADFWIQELVRAVQRELYGAARSTLVADADGEPSRKLELARRWVEHRVDGRVADPLLGLGRDLHAAQRVADGGGREAGVLGQLADRGAAPGAAGHGRSVLGLTVAAVASNMGEAVH